MSEEQDYRASVNVSEEQKVQSRRLGMMRQVVGSLMDFEEMKKRGMSWHEMIIQTGLGGVNLKDTVDDLIKLRYVVCTTMSDVEEISGEVRINKLSELYATTFFGRTWFLDKVIR